MSDENGLVYMRARYYSPTFKRFINADVVAGSITNAITLNRYAYANGNPVSNVDPFGLSPDERGNMTSSIVVKSRIGRYSKLRYSLEDSLRTFLEFKTSYDFDIGWETEPLAIGMTYTPFGDKTYIPYALYDSDRNSRPGVFSDTILSGEIELPNYNVTENELTVFSGDINLITGCWHMGDAIDLALLDIGHAELDLSFSDSGFEANALISAWSPSITLDFGGYEIEFSFEVGAIGAKASLDFEKGTWSLGVAKGFGFTISGGRSDD